MEEAAPGGAPGRRAAPRAMSPPRGALDGIRKDHERQKAARASGVTLKSGTAWSNAFLNQKSWHPLSYRNQKALWVAEQAAASRADSEAKAKDEFEAEQEYFKNLASLPSQEQKKLAAAQSVSFMYQKPPGYDAMRQREAAAAAAAAREAAAAEAAAAAAAAGAAVPAAALPAPHAFAKDAFGRRVATAAEFPAMANAPREPGTAPSLAVSRPFGAPPPRAVQCARCGAFGHGLGDAACAAAGGPSARSLRLEDPLTLMRARAELEEHPKFVLKRPMTGRSPPRGAALPGAENQQLLADEGAGAGAGAAALGAAFGERDSDSEAAAEAAAIAAFAAAAAAAGDGGAAALAALSKRDRKALLRAYARAEKAQRRAAQQQRVAAAEAYLRQHGGGAAAATAEVGEGERESKRKRKKRAKDKERKATRRSGGSDSSSGS